MYLNTLVINNIKIENLASIKLKFQNFDKASIPSETMPNYKRHFIITKMVS